LLLGTSLSIIPEHNRGQPVHPKPRHSSPRHRPPPSFGLFCCRHCRLQERKGLADKSIDTYNDIQIKGKFTKPTNLESSCLFLFSCIARNGLKTTRKRFERKLATRSMLTWRAVVWHPAFDAIIAHRIPDQLFVLPNLTCVVGALVRPPKLKYKWEIER